MLCRTQSIVSVLVRWEPLSKTHTHTHSFPSIHFGFIACLLTGWHSGNSNSNSNSNSNGKKFHLLLMLHACWSILILFATFCHNRLLLTVKCKCDSLSLHATHSLDQVYRQVVNTSAFSIGIISFMHCTLFHTLCILCYFTGCTTERSFNYIWRNENTFSMLFFLSVSLFLSLNSLKKEQQPNLSLRHIQIVYTQWIFEKITITTTTARNDMYEYIRNRKRILGSTQGGH